MMQAHTQTPDAAQKTDLLVKVEPEIVAAGGELVMHCAVRAANAADLPGQEVQVFDGAGRRIGAAALADLDGSTWVSAPLSVTAPAELGRQNWRAVFTDPSSGQQTSREFAFEVIAHRTSLLVWGAPSAIGAGSDFTVTVGLKCSGGCAMAGREVEIFDETGTRLASVKMSPEIRPGSSGLFQTEVSLRAPDQIARQVWEARIVGHDDAYPHEPAAACFGLNFVAAPEHRVTIEVTDASTKAPIRGASVVMHPFRATTDGDGIATFSVCKGDYTIWVSAAGHDPVCKYVDIAADYASTAELSEEIKEDPDAFYY